MADSLSISPSSKIVEASLEEWDKDLDKSPEVVKLFATTAQLDSAMGEFLDNFFLDDMDMEKVRQNVLEDGDYVQIQQATRKGLKINDLEKAHPG